MVDDRSRKGEGGRESARDERAREEREGNRGREGFGDDGGTRVGRPTPADISPAEPGRDSVSEGPEGSAPRDAHAPLGMGTEAAEGLHGASSERASGDRDGRAPGARKPARKDGERDAAKDDAAGEEGADRQGSEPLVHRDTTHSSNYGGEMGEPRK